MRSGHEPAGQPVVRHNLDADAFPFTIQAHCEASDELLWEHVCEGPGPIEVPGFAPRQISITIIAADGTSTTMWSWGQEGTRGQ